MIRSVRRVIAGISTEQILSDEALLTVTTMAEGIVNNRPITPNSCDPSDLSAICPNQFLNLQPVGDITGNFDQNCLKKNCRQVQYLSSVLWKIWLKEYLPRLQERTKWFYKTRNVQEGDLVLIVDATQPKNEWPLARVSAVFKGSDGQVRTVKVKTRNTELKRPINKICILEVSDDMNNK